MFPDTSPAKTDPSCYGLSLLFIYFKKNLGKPIKSETIKLLYKSKALRCDSILVLALLLNSLISVRLMTDVFLKSSYELTTRGGSKLQKGILGIFLDILGVGCSKIRFYFCVL